MLLPTIDLLPTLMLSCARHGAPRRYRLHLDHDLVRVVRCYGTCRKYEELSLQVLKDMVAEHGLPTPICWVHLPLRGTVNKRYFPTHDAYTIIHSCTSFEHLRVPVF
jgi:hypothetical protein